MRIRVPDDLAFHYERTDRQMLSIYRALILVAVALLIVSALKREGTWTAVAAGGMLAPWLAAWRARRVRREQQRARERLGRLAPIGWAGNGWLTEQGLTLSSGQLIRWRRILQVEMRPADGGGPAVALWPRPLALAGAAVFTAVTLLVGALWEVVTCGLAARAQTAPFATAAAGLAAIVTVALLVPTWRAVWGHLRASAGRYQSGALAEPILAILARGRRDVGAVQGVLLAQTESRGRARQRVGRRAARI